MQDGSTITQDIKFADDGKTMTINSKAGDKSWTDVYDRSATGTKKAPAKKAAK